MPATSAGNESRRRTDAPGRAPVGALPSELVREDALPEHLQYRDQGCDIHPSCLTCPLPRCRYDEPGGARALLNLTRDQEILHLRRRQGLPIATLARRYGVSRRTVFRILRKGAP